MGIAPFYGNKTSKMRKVMDKTKAETIQNSISELPWTIPIGPDLFPLSRIVLRKNLNIAFRAALWGFSALSLFFLQDYLLRWLHLGRIASSLWALF